VAGEELGMVGCLFILLFLAAIILGCMVLARKGDRLLALTAMGVAGMVGSQTILNVAMCLYAAPVIGVTLPFFSYGGSSLLASFGAVGILLSLGKERKKLTG
jgi:rod shape determining protein RodA